MRLKSNAKRYRCQPRGTRHMPVSAEDFAAIALSFPEAVQAAHMGQTDFRVAKKIFATLKVDAGLGTLKLLPD